MTPVGACFIESRIQGQNAKDPKIVHFSASLASLAQTWSTC